MAFTLALAEVSVVLRSINLNAILLVAAILVVAIILYLVKGSRDAGLDHVPGPWLARYTNLHAWIEAQRWHGRNICYLSRLHDKYGDVVRVAPRRVSVCDPDAIPAIYGMRASLDKSNLIRAAQPLGKGGPDNLFSVRDAKSHAPMRRAVANAYSTSTIAQYEPRIDDTLAAFFRVLEGESSETNIGKWTHYYVYDVQGNMTYAEPLGYLETRSDALGLIWQTKLLLKYVQFTMPMPILHDIASFFIRTFKVQRATVFHQLSARKVQDRMAELSSSSTVKGSSSNNNNNSYSDILTHFVSARDKYPQLMTLEQIIMHCMVNVVAGTGTSTTTIINVLKYLVANPEAQQRLYDELKDAGVGFPPTWRETQSLPFLEGLVREGVRLRGVDGFNPLARVVKEEGMVLPDGTRLPPGTVVGIKPSVASVQEKTFGKQPRSFLPDRWCQKDGESDEEYRERRGPSAGTR
ncbi:hypothetical protein DL764_007771 [Monosporascus ibericus]|uniref:Cytochrome P450 n=1 Tax=Monosporascus ibericus TaxID=155417 RepID=A0A4Q4T1D7_9PEZI|nr:hypothetical protein DL764_007771 [Monosporascus ibericus]